jgi:microcompartment protein CcmK/EutM
MIQDFSGQFRKSEQVEAYVIGMIVATSHNRSLTPRKILVEIEAITEAHKEFKSIS